MEEMELIKQKLDLTSRELDLLSKSVGLESERVSKAFGQLGNLTDLVYLEISVLIEYLMGKGIVVEKEFTDALERTAKKVEESIKKNQETKASDEEQKIITKL